MTNPRFARPGTVLLIMALAGCGSEVPQTPEPSALRTFNAGDLDPFACPYVDPVPWEGELVHAQVCGPGCRPTSSRRIDASPEEIQLVCQRTCETIYPPLEFIACVSEEVPPFPYEVVLTEGVALGHPVTGRTYGFGSAIGAWPYYHLCWGPPASQFESSFSSGCTPTPDFCFEEPVVRPNCGFD